VWYSICQCVKLVGFEKQQREREREREREGGREREGEALGNYVALPFL
jgi:hypothetical protein